MAFIQYMKNTLKVVVFIALSANLTYIHIGMVKLRIQVKYGYVDPKMVNNL